MTSNGLINEHSMSVCRPAPSTKDHHRRRHLARQKNRIGRLSLPHLSPYCQLVVVLALVFICDRQLHSRTLLFASKVYYKSFAGRVSVQKKIKFKIVSDTRSHWQI